MDLENSTPLTSGMATLEQSRLTRRDVDDVVNSPNKVFNILIAKQELQKLLAEKTAENDALNDALARERTLAAKKRDERLAEQTVAVGAGVAQGDTPSTASGEFKNDAITFVANAALGGTSVDGLPTAHVEMFENFMTHVDRAGLQLSFLAGKEPGTYQELFDILARNLGDADLWKEILSTSSADAGDIQFSKLKLQKLLQTMFPGKNIWNGGRSDAVAEPNQLNILEQLTLLLSKTSQSQPPKSTSNSSNGDISNEQVMRNIDWLESQTFEGGLSFKNGKLMVMLGDSFRREIKFSREFDSDTENYYKLLWLQNIFRALKDAVERRSSVSDGHVDLMKLMISNLEAKQVAGIGRLISLGGRWSLNQMVDVFKTKRVKPSKKEDNSSQLLLIMSELGIVESTKEMTDRRQNQMIGVVHWIINSFVCFHGANVHVHTLARNMIRTLDILFKKSILIKQTSKLNTDLILEDEAKIDVDDVVYSFLDAFIAIGMALVKSLDSNELTGPSAGAAVELLLIDNNIEGVASHKFGSNVPQTTLSAFVNAFKRLNRAYVDALRLSDYDKVAKLGMRSPPSAGESKSAGGKPSPKTAKDKSKMAEAKDKFTATFRRMKEKDPEKYDGLPDGLPEDENGNKVTSLEGGETIIHCPHEVLKRLAGGATKAGFSCAICFHRDTWSEKLLVTDADGTSREKLVKGCWSKGGNGRPKKRRVHFC